MNRRNLDHQTYPGRTLLLILYLLFTLLPIYWMLHMSLRTNEAITGGFAWWPESLNFANYWNQVTPENGGKWGTVEGTRDVMNWTQADAAYALAKANGFPFKWHAFVWGNQQPAWIESLSTAEVNSPVSVTVTLGSVRSSLVTRSR